MTYDIGIIGGGAWGTALAQVQAVSGRNPILWAREAAVVNAINNALRPLDAAVWSQPVTPEKVLRALGRL